jgi:hypothetical protein
LSVSRRSIVIVLGLIGAAVLASAPALQSLKTDARAAVVGSGFTAVTPCRMFDTRTASTTGECLNATPIPAARIGPAGVLAYTVTGATGTGVAGIPATATAIVINVTAFNASAPTFISVYPAGLSARPVVSSLNVNNSAAIPNLVTVPLIQTSAGQVVDFYNPGGYVDLIADLAGYYAPSGGAGFTPMTPCRVFDTRALANATCAGASATQRLTPGGTLSVQLAGVAGVPSTATAVVLNVTALNSSGPDYISVFPHDAPRPTVSNLNINDAGAVPNLVTVQLSADGKVDFYSAGASIDLLADISGYYEPGTGYLFTPVTPCRVYDTRTGTGNCNPGVSADRGGKNAAGAVVTVPMPGLAGIPIGAKAVVLNVTALEATTPTYLSVFPDDVSALPAVSNLNVNTPWAVPNAVIVAVPGGDPASDPAPAGLVDFYNAGGNVSIIVDVYGYFS